MQSHSAWISGAYSPLNDGGVFVSGLHDHVIITYNEIIKVGGDAISVQAGSNVTHATIANNFMQGSKLGIAPNTVSGTTTPNTIIP